MKIQEIKARELDVKEFIRNKIKEISETVGSDYVICALSGGVDSSVVTMLAYKALGKRLITYFIDNGLMREGEPKKVVSLFKSLGVPIKVIEAKKEFFDGLKGITDPEQKREVISQTFYKKVFGRLVRVSSAKYLLQGTILTDVDETVAGIKRQHNVFEQLGINPQKAFGYKIIEPLIQLRKDGVRKIAKALGLPESTFARIPFPGPALAARVIGEVTPEKIAMVRKATLITEKELAVTKAFQCMAILHQDKVTGIRDGQRAFGWQIEIRCWQSTDARRAKPVRVSYRILERLAKRITLKIPEIVSVTYNITPKPPSAMEAV